MSGISLTKVNATRSVAVVLAISFILLGLYSAPLHVAASSQATVVQENAVGCNPRCSSITVSLNSPVAMGDVLVVGVSTVLASISSISDSLSTPYTLAVSTSNSGTIQYANIYYSPVYTSGSDTITVTFSGSTYADVYVFELSGVSATGVTTVSGSGTGTSAATTPATFQPGAFIMSVVNNEGNSITQGSGFTRVGGPSSYSIAEYADSGVPSPTNFPASWTNAFTWIEPAIVFEPLPITTVTTTLTTVSTSIVTQTSVSTTTYTLPVTTTTTQFTTVTQTSTATVYGGWSRFRKSKADPLPLTEYQVGLVSVTVCPLPVVLESRAWI